MTKSLEFRLKIKKQENCSDLKGKAIINATGVFTNAIMKLNDTVYCPKSEFTLYLINLSYDHALMIPKQVMGEFYLQCLGTTK
jgi:glycerol-3-phosphate dehydrogenase